MKKKEAYNKCNIFEVSSVENKSIISHLKKKLIRLMESVPISIQLVNTPIKNTLLQKQLISFIEKKKR